MLIEAALQKGIVVVAATRNEDALATSSFPASIPGVIAVTDSGHERSRNSDQPVFAPSENIFTTLPRDQYNFVSGTSLGAAQVAGYIALLLQENPHLSTPLIRDRLIEINNREAAGRPAPPMPLSN